MSSPKVSDIKNIPPHRRPSRWGSSDSEEDISLKKSKRKKKQENISLKKSCIKSVESTEDNETNFLNHVSIVEENVNEKSILDKEIHIIQQQKQQWSASLFSFVYGCRSVNCYERLNHIDEGTYGVVSRARDIKTGEIVALKQVKMTNDVCKEGFPITALREANVLLELSHPNIINVREMVVGSSMDKIYMVMDYAESDLKNVMETKMKEPFLPSEIKCLMYQLLSAIAYMHSKWYLHRDLKTSNLLYTKKGCLKVCDFGLARNYGSPIRSYTYMVVTLWYRCPELLLGEKTYSTAVDMWSIGCIFAEFVLRKPLFPGKGEIDQLDKIFKCLGLPTNDNWPGYSKLPNTQNIKWKAPKQSILKQKVQDPLTMSTGTLSNAGLDLLENLLKYDPTQRISAQDALNHPYFKEEPLPLPMNQMPIF